MKVEAEIEFILINLKLVLGAALLGMMYARNPDSSNLLEMGKDFCIFSSSGAKLR